MFWSGNFTDKGKLDLVFMPGQAGDLCNAKIIEKKTRYHKVSPCAPLVKIGSEVYVSDPIPTPCGHCVGCRMDNAKAWMVRFTHEMESRKDLKAYFVTLTYSPETCPDALVKEDFRKFYNALRFPSYGVRREVIFFACGEYGSLNSRPHFHALLLVPELDDLIPYEFKSYHSRTIDSAWDHKGITDVKEIEPAMISYVVGYVEKKQSDPNWDSYKVKPFTLKSRGLGFSYIDRLTGSPDRKVYGTFGKSHYAAIPRAYLRKCEDEPWFDDYKAASVALANSSLAAKLSAIGNTDPDILGSVLEASYIERLDKKRIPKL